MNERDERIRDALTEALARVGVDARSLAIEVVDGDVIVRGSVSSPEQEALLAGVLRQQQGASVDCDVVVRAVAPSDEPDGRGRSPITGTSADSAHESRHQLDRR
jgi:hypothetical protein